MMDAFDIRMIGLTNKHMSERKNERIEAKESEKQLNMVGWERDMEKDMEFANIDIN